MTWHDPSPTRFCEACDVVLDLHPRPDEDDPAERGCDIAERKAELLESWPWPGLAT